MGTSIDFRNFMGWRFNVIPRRSETSTIDLSGCEIWLDAGEGVTSSGGAVSLWEDQSGNGRDVAQSDEARKPTYVANGVNGKPTIRFDGTFDYLVNSSITGLSSLTGCTYFVCGMTTAQANNRLWWLLEGTYPAIGTYIVSDALYTYASSESVYAYGSKGITGTNDLFQIYSTVYDGTLTGDDNRLKLWHNGTQLTSLTIPVSIPAALDSGVNTLAVGDRPGSTIYHKGDIAEIIVYSTALSDTKRKAVESYLGTKYGVTVAA